MLWKQSSFNNKRLFLFLVIPQFFVWFLVSLFYAGVDIIEGEQMILYVIGIYGLLIFDVIIYAVYFLLWLSNLPKGSRAKPLMFSIVTFLLSQVASIVLAFIFVIITGSFYNFYKLIFY